MKPTTTLIPPVSDTESTPTREGIGTPGGPMAASNGCRPASEEYPTADFYEPIDFAWSEETFAVRQALKKYSEEIHADY